MKGINKYINDIVSEESMKQFGVSFKAILSSKMTKNVFLVKEEQHKIHFNRKICMMYSNQKDKIAEIIYDAINFVVVYQQVPQD